jgi:hypothetical protein
MGKPQNFTSYFYISPVGTPRKAIWLDNADDKMSLKFFNVFETQKECEREIERIKAHRELLSLCDWKGGLHWHIGYDEFEDEFFPQRFETVFSPYKFAKKDSVIEAIEFMGSDRLKLIFGA